VKKIERNNKQQKYVDERFAALDSALQEVEGSEYEYHAAAEVGFQISRTCPRVLAEYFTARAEKAEAVTAPPTYVN
jgi:hypothetical protein